MNKYVKKEILSNIYKTTSKLIITENDVDYINDYYKNNFKKIKNYEDLLIDNKFSSLIRKLHSAEYEIKKQFLSKKALQRGIIAECNYSESIAKIFGLNKVIDLDNVKYNEVPKEFSEFVQNSAQTFSGARYLFYNNKDKKVFIFQYGNPALGDAEIIYDGFKIRLEYKERGAKLGEFDLTYDDSGKLIASDKIRKEMKVLELLIDCFNHNTNVFNEIGHNYKSFDENTCVMAAKLYINTKGIDLIISSVDDSIVALTDDCFGCNLETGNSLVSLDGSEIRTTGRNDKSLWTKQHFKEVLRNLEAVEIGEGLYYIDKTKIEFRNRAGHTDISGIKIGKIYFVRVDDIIEKDKGYVFNINDVRQSVPTISMHMYIMATKDELQKYLKV